MKTIIFLVAIISVFSFHTSVWATIPDYISPDRHYAIEVKKIDDKNGVKMVYDLVDLKLKKTTFRVESSHQPINYGKGQEELNLKEIERTLELSHDAEVYWSSDTKLVAIDEGNYRFSGRLILLSVSPQKVFEINLPMEELFKRTNFLWQRFRIRVKEGWSDNRVIQLEMNGIAGISTLKIYKNISCQFDLKLDENLFPSIMNLKVNEE